MREFAYDSPILQDRMWPYVPEFTSIPTELADFLAMSTPLQHAKLRDLQAGSEVHAAFVNTALALIYAYRLGYADSPCFLGADDRLESQLENAKIVLERELVGFLGQTEPTITSQRELVVELKKLVADNPGVNHPLFDFLDTEANADTLRLFLLNDVIRNEIVDDEVAWLVAGQQGLMKEATAINLYDECGRGKQRHFHTYWLRILLESLDCWDDLLAYRNGSRPWYAGITSNVFAMLLTRSPYKTAAYGHFIITEGWVPPHFEKIMRGMERVGLTRDENDIYFSAHVTLDPTHTEELIMGLDYQVPELSAHQCSGILWGCHLAIAGAVAQYDRMLLELQQQQATSV